MKYLVIGAGGTGGGVGGFLARGGRDVTLIARNAHLQAMRAKGLTLHYVDEVFTVPVDAADMAGYQARIAAGEQRPDVIFLCVKGYSLEETVPFIRAVAHENTVVIPVLNIYGTGGRLQEQLPELTVTDGCIYIASEICAPGELMLNGKIFRVVYGLRRNTTADAADRVMPVLQAVQADLLACGISGELSDFIERDALQKFSFVSCMAAVGAAYDVTASGMQPGGPYRQEFTALVQEVLALAEAMGIPLAADTVERNLKIMDDLQPAGSSSMQRDIKAGKASEVDGLVYEVVRLGEKYGVEVPTYGKLAGILRCAGC